jgi:Protein of unknown function (DUF3298)
MTAMRKAVIAALRIERRKPGSEASAREEWLKGVEPRPTGIGAVALAPSTEAGKISGFIFYFPPYAVGPHADGQYAAFVPWETLKSYLFSRRFSDFWRRSAEGTHDDQELLQMFPIAWAFEKLGPFLGPFGGWPACATHEIITAGRTSRPALTSRPCYEQCRTDLRTQFL